MNDYNAQVFCQARQHLARQLRTEHDVSRLVDEIAPVYRRVLSGWLPRDRASPIYEAACGPGIILQFLRREGYTNVEASDTAGPSVKLARSSGFAVVEADSIAEITRLPSDRLDCIIALDFIEHLSRDDVLRFLGECYRVLRLGGCIILRAPNADSPLVGRNLFNDITHVWAYTTIATEALLRLTGYSTVSFSDESLAALSGPRWLKVPIMWAGRRLLSMLFKAATREIILYWGPSIYIFARK